MPTVHVVGISDCKVSNDPEDAIVTYALGSCVGLALYDPAARVGGILHLMLPDSRYRSGVRDFNPHTYADTGFCALLDATLELGASRERLIAKIAGGSNMLRYSSLLDIGRRNAEAVLELVVRENIPVAGTSLGGTVGRSMQLQLDDGSVSVRLLGQGQERL